MSDFRWTGFKVVATNNQGATYDLEFDPDDLSALVEFRFPHFPATIEDGWVASWTQGPVQGHVAVTGGLTKATRTVDGKESTASGVKYMTLNEWREQYGMPPVEWGNAPWMYAVHGT